VFAAHERAGKRFATTQIWQRAQELRTVFAKPHGRALICKREYRRICYRANSRLMDSPILKTEASPGVTDEKPTRKGKELIEATRPFAKEAVFRSNAHLVLGLAIAAGCALIAARDGWWPLRCLASVGEGLIIVRLFIIYHDFMHGSVLRNSRIARAILHTFGFLVMAPPRVWRETHNYHHAHTAKIVGSGIGSFPMVTTAMWQKMPKAMRLRYRAARHPLTILFGYFTLFMWGFCIASLVRAPRKYWSAGVAVLLNWALTFAIAKMAGAATLALAFGLPLAIACALGGYLFYAQHNFPGMDVQPRETWSFADAALRSSSYMRTGRFMTFVTGNIGFHHVHHLNPSIPFYRLPEAMRSIPELQDPITTSLSPKDVRACLSLKLWDAERGTLVAFPR